jgi:hypothetical protein
MSLRPNIPDPDEMNEQRALWAEVALREFAYEISGPQGMADTPNLDNVAVCPAMGRVGYPTFHSS